MSPRHAPTAHQVRTPQRARSEPSHRATAAASDPAVEVFHAGTRRDGKGILADGGRVLGVTARGKDIAQARDRAYAAIAKIDWPDGFCRTDIGWRALKAQA